MGRGKRNLIDVLAGRPWSILRARGAITCSLTAYRSGLPVKAGRWQARASASAPLPLLGRLFLGICAIGTLV